MSRVVTNRVATASPAEPPPITTKSKTILEKSPGLNSLANAFCKRRAERDKHAAILMVGAILASLASSCSLPHKYSIHVSYCALYSPKFTLNHHPSPGHLTTDISKLERFHISDRIAGASERYLCSTLRKTNYWLFLTDMVEESEEAREG